MTSGAGRGHAIVHEERVVVAGVPARVYRPAGATGLLLLGHRGTQGKDHPRFVELGRQLADRTGLAVVCIDAPAHGERSPATGDPDKDFEVVVSTVTGPQDITVADWHVVTSELSAIGPPRAYMGFSMGAMMGIAVVAAMASIKVAVLWAAGLPPAPPGAEPTEPNSFVAAAEAAGHAEILMINMRNDEMFGPSEAVALFDLIGGGRKRLMLWPGEHGTEPEEALDLAVQFVSRHAQ